MVYFYMELGIFSASVIDIGAWKWLPLPLLCFVSVRKWGKVNLSCDIDTVPTV